MSPVVTIHNSAAYHDALAQAGSKLVVADFTASWCGPCQRIAPVFESLSNKYLQAVFLKIDVDECSEVAASQGVTAMPTFILFKNKVKIDSVQGADPNGLEARIKQHYSDGEPSDVAGHVDLSTFILKDKTSCLNESDSQTVQNVLKNDGSWMESDADEQLIISVAFSQPVKIHSLKVKAPTDSGPKDLRLFVNQPGNLDFDSAEKLKALQEITLTPDDLNGNPINLKFVKFQNVQSIDIFVVNNQQDTDVTKIQYLGFIGTPISSTNMNAFKRVGGKKGESH